MKIYTSKNLIFNPESVIMIWIDKKKTIIVLVIKNLVKILRGLISNQESVIVTWINKKEQLV